MIPFRSLKKLEKTMLTVAKMENKRGIYHIVYCIEEKKRFFFALG